MGVVVGGELYICRMPYPSQTTRPAHNHGRCIPLYTACSVVPMYGHLSCFALCLLQFAGSKDNFAAKIDDDTAKELRELSHAVDAHKEEVLKRLTDLVFDIKPAIHQNLRLKEELDKR